MISILALTTWLISGNQSHVPLNQLRQCIVSVIRILFTTCFRSREDRYEFKASTHIHVNIANGFNFIFRI